MPSELIGQAAQTGLSPALCGIGHCFLSQYLISFPKVGHPTGCPCPRITLTLAQLHSHTVGWPTAPNNGTSLEMPRRSFTLRKSTSLESVLENHRPLGPPKQLCGQQLRVAGAGLKNLHVGTQLSWFQSLLRLSLGYVALDKLLNLSVCLFLCL